MSARAAGLATAAATHATAGAGLATAAATHADRPLTVLDRAAGWFVAPAAEVPHPARAPAALDGAARAVVLGSPRDAPPVAAAVAGALRSVMGARAAVTAIWAPGEPAERAASHLALPAARRLAATLALRGLAATARGRLAWVDLVPAEDGAVTQAARLGGGVEVPVVTALAGPRPAGVEALIAGAGLVVVVAADPEGPLARLALAGLASIDATALATGPLQGPPRLAALAGVAGLRSLDEPLRAAVRAFG